MVRGSFFEQFFADRGGLGEPNTQGEINVLCPFPHAKGYETRPSAHVNLDKGVFHCKTCEAEMRFDSGGLSEVRFVSMFYGVSYTKAIRMLDYKPKQTEDPDTWQRSIDMLLNSCKADLAYLEARGIPLEAVKEYNLGSDGSYILYPITMNGVFLDVRSYNREPTPDNPAKMKSKSGTTGCYLFPYDHWSKDERPTLLCAGENDALLARVRGFNAITGTGGEGRFPEMFAYMFKGRDVYICYDCDEAGRKGAASAGYHLKEAGANVFVVDLGLPGTKGSKDITDFFIKEGKTAAELQALMDAAPVYSKELENSVKNHRYPLVDLWRVVEGTYHGKRISSRVVLSGIYDQGMKVPAAVEWSCTGAIDGNAACQGCSMAGESGTWMADEHVRDVLKLVEVSDKEQRSQIRSLVGFPDKCPRPITRPIAYEPVFKVVFTPDVDSMNEDSGTRLVEMYGYTIGLNTELEDGNKYRAYFETHAHPKDQRAFMIVDKVEESDNSVNAFRMTPEINQQLQVFKGDPFKMMDERAKRMHSLTVFYKPYKLVADSYNISFHSVLEFKLFGRLMKGYPEIYIAGDTRTGKTETGKTYQSHIRLGSTTEVKNATVAGLIGGADSIPSGGWRINWGVIPKNHRGMLILDEAGGLSHEIISKMTGMRSEGIAKIEKIAKGSAPARTRLVWIANPRTVNGIPKTVSQYANGIQIMQDLIGAPEDIARFDACVIIEDDGRESNPNEQPEVEMWDAEACRNLVCWAWSRKADQVQFAPGIEDYLVMVAHELNAKFDCSVKFLGKEAFKKIARIAVACAASCYSTEDGETVLVDKVHIDWAVDYLTRCYSDKAFRLDDFAKRERDLKTTNQAINDMVASIYRRHQTIIKILLEAVVPISPANLQVMSGVDRTPFSELMQKMVSASLINYDASKGITASERLRQAVKAIRKDERDIEIIPLTEKDGIM